jgi:hypothetical protein
MNILSKLIASLAALVVTVFLVGLPDLSMAQVPGATVAGVHTAHVCHTSARAS